MMRGFLSPQTTVPGSADLLELVSELIEAHADTVELLLADEPDEPDEADQPDQPDEPDELERWAHLDYLRALQRLGHATLASHGQRPPPAPRPPLRHAVQGCAAAVAILVRAAAPMLPRALGLLGIDDFTPPPVQFR